MRLLFTILSMLFSLVVVAQEAICLPAATFPNGIEYDTGQVSAFLHIGHYKAIFYSEQHNNTFDPELKYNLIRHLNTNYGFKDVFMEVGISAAWRFNQYLKSGDTSWLYSSRLALTAGGYGNFWRDLYAYNLQLPDSSKIIIHGVDFERTDLFSTLDLLQQDEDIPAALMPVHDTIKTHITDKPLIIYAVKHKKVVLLKDEEPFNQTMQYVRTAFAANDAAARVYFGENYQLAKEMLDNPGRAMLYPKPRNKTIAQLMDRDIERDGIHKFIAFFGSSHTDYTITSSITNAVAGMDGFGRNAILNIREIVYDMQAPGGFALKAKEPFAKWIFKPGCKATIIPAAAIRPYKHKADFIIIMDSSN